MKCDDGLYRLLDACRNMKNAWFTIEEYNISLENVLDCTAKMVNVAWKKEMQIVFEAFYRRMGRLCEGPVREGRSCGRTEDETSKMHSRHKLDDTVQ